MRSENMKSASKEKLLSSKIVDELKIFKPLFSIAPILKSSIATIINLSKSNSRPKRCSSHSIALTNACKQKSVLLIFFSLAHT